MEMTKEFFEVLIIFICAHFFYLIIPAENMQVVDISLAQSFRGDELSYGVDCVYLTAFILRIYFIRMLVKRVYSFTR